MARRVYIYARALKESVEGDEDTLDIMEALAEEIAEVALENARVIIPNIPEGFMQVESGRDSRGFFFIAEPDGGGKWTEYLSAKERSEPGAWFANAVQEVIGVHNLRADR